MMGRGMRATVCSIACVVATGSRAAEPAGQPVKITSIIASFTNGRGPEFLVTYVVSGDRPVAAEDLANAVEVRVGGSTYRRQPIICNCIPSLIEPGSERWEYVALVDFLAPLSPGKKQTVSVLIAGVESPPAEFIWNPQPARPTGAPTGGGATS